MRARHFWGSPLYRPTLIGISTLPHGTMGLPLFCSVDGKRSLSNASTVVENQTFGAGVTKNILRTIQYFYYGYKANSFIKRPYKTLAV